MTAAQLCIYVALLVLDVFGQEIVITLETKSLNKPQRGPIITLNDTGVYPPSCFRGGSGITLSFPLFGSFFMALTPLRNGIITDTLENSLCQTACRTVAFSPVPPLNLSLALSHCY